MVRGSDEDGGICESHKRHKGVSVGFSLVLRKCCSRAPQPHRSTLNTLLSRLDAPHSCSTLVHPHVIQICQGLTFWLKKSGVGGEVWRSAAQRSSAVKTLIIRTLLPRFLLSVFISINLICTAHHAKNEVVAGAQSVSVHSIASATATMLLHLSSVRP